MKLNTYLNYGGNCADAFRFYEKNLGGKIGMMMTHGEMPGPVTVKPEWKDKVLHASITIGGTPLMASDVPPETFQPMKSAYLCLALDTDAEADRVFKLLSEGGEVFMPIQETFWAHKFGMLVDRVGTPWMVNCAKPM